MIKNKKGFSLLELLIVLSIFSILTTVLVANHRRFGNNIILTGLADDVALSIREAQTFGLGSKRADVGNNDGDAFQNPYGVYISEANNNQYVLFADTNNTVFATDSGDVDGWDDLDTVIRTYTFPGGNIIDHFCVRDGGGDLRCSNSDSSIDSMSITFLRPNPDAKIIADEEIFSQGMICLVSQNGKQKQVEVLASGQIQVVDECD